MVISTAISILFDMSVWHFVVIITNSFSVSMANHVGLFNIIPNCDKLLCFHFHSMLDTSNSIYRLTNQQYNTYLSEMYCFFFILSFISFTCSQLFIKHFWHMSFLHFYIAIFSLELLSIVFKLEIKPEIICQTEEK